MNYYNNSLSLEFFEPKLEDMKSGSLFSYYHPKMKKSDGSWQKHFFCLLKSSKNGKFHLMLPLTSSCPNSGHDKWSLQYDSSHLMLPHPYNKGMNGKKNPSDSYLSCNMLQWFTTEELLMLGMKQHGNGEYSLNYLGELPQDFMDELFFCLETDLYKNLPTEKKPLSLYHKMMKTYESTTGTTYMWKGFPYP